VGESIDKLRRLHTSLGPEWGTKSGTIVQGCSTSVLEYRKLEQPRSLMSCNRDARSTPGGASKHITDEIGLLPLNASKKTLRAVKLWSPIPRKSHRRTRGMQKKAVRAYNGRARQPWALTRSHICSMWRPMEGKYRDAAMSLDRRQTCVTVLRSAIGSCSKIINVSSFGKGQHEVSMPHPEKSAGMAT
jgi:hypothetical protein